MQYGSEQESITFTASILSDMTAGIYCKYIKIDSKKDNAGNEAQGYGWAILHLSGSTPETTPTPTPESTPTSNAALLPVIPRVMFWFPVFHRL
jgi:hypothetical protein